MPDRIAMTPDQAGAMRRLPSVRRLSGVLRDASGGDATQPVCTSVARVAIDAHRRAIVAGDPNAVAAGEEAIVARATALLQAALAPPLPAAINATGVLIHTGLGRAQLAKQAIEAMVAAAGAVPVEIDVQTGRRGRRRDVVESLLCELTGAEAAVVVNNNAAAMMLALAVAAPGGEVVVSRGELVEIGGSFRLPEIIHSGGAMLREVGTTNKTRASDYDLALADGAVAVLKVHASNFRIEGFTAEATTEQLAEVASRHGAPLLYDTGSGLLNRNHGVALDASEPDAATAIAQGADLVFFSGDKLLGGPQAGCIVGKAELVDAVDAHPMMRAMRVDKITLAALAATLRLHRDPASAKRQIPVLAAASMGIEELRSRAERVRAGIGNALGDAAGVDAAVRDSAAYLGGGAAPACTMASIALRLGVQAGGEGAMAARLRTGKPGVFTRVEAGAVWIDFRSVRPGQDEELTGAIVRALGAT